MVFWDIYYRYFLPNTSILLVTPLVGALLALVFHWLALRLPGNPIVSFCLLGGLESLLEHLWGIYGLGILRAPLMQAVAPLSILAFAVPEYIFYWCVVLSIAVLLQSVYRRLIA